MQPYFFPYIGYFQLMHAVDTFIFFDDVQYIDRGWVNRNRIRENGMPAWLTLPVHGGRRELSINQRHYFSDEATTKRITRRLQASYARAPYRSDTVALLSKVFGLGQENVADFNACSLKEIASQLGITCQFLMSSQIDKEAQLKGQDKIIDLCLRLGVDQYINPIGGVDLYNPETFDKNGLQLRFLETEVPAVDLGGTSSHLSIIDTLMHKEKSAIKGDLSRCRLLPHPDQCGLPS